MSLRSYWLWQVVTKPRLPEQPRQSYVVVWRCVYCHQRFTRNQTDHDNVKLQFWCSTCGAITSHTMEHCRDAF